MEKLSEFGLAEQRELNLAICKQLVVKITSPHERGSDFDENIFTSKIG
jgi:hypothetical protein